MIVGTLIVMVAMNVMTNVVYAQDHLTLNVPPVSKTISLIQQQLVMMYAQKVSMETLKAGSVKIAISNVNCVMVVVTLSAQPVIRITSCQQVRAV
jgi:hypothetical protein